ncbi:hypothetical protein WG901_08950 [Novosphingobium sp. PS1R-30]|uniref:Uncharacterized protein n=1 Tax=Novosphingobium anseongense TaxID=3133436 RepID=A0ABU8RVF5_9SPHN|nr:MAG: hypothetical protein EOO76_06245 [Novosphingobium sp.]
MFGPRITTVFRSKWRALWFAASVLLGVWFSVPKQGEKTDPAQQQAIEAVAGLVGQGQPAPAEKHVNPWAKDKP